MFQILYTKFDPNPQLRFQFKVLLFPSHLSHLCVPQRLPQQIEERNEKLKEEMMGTYCP